MSPDDNSSRLARPKSGRMKKIKTKEQEIYNQEVLSHEKFETVYRIAYEQVYEAVQNPDQIPHKRSEIKRAIEKS